MFPGLPQWGKPLTDAVLIMRPHLWSIIIFAACWLQRNTPVKFTLRTLSQSSLVRSKNSFGLWTPALFTKISTVPNVFTVSLNNFSTSLGFDMSAWIKMALPPSFSINFLMFLICASIVLSLVSLKCWLSYASFNNSFLLNIIVLLHYAKVKKLGHIL